MVTMVMNGYQGFLPGKLPGNHDYQVIWLPPMHGNHGNFRLPGNLPGNHTSPREVIVQLKKWIFILFGNCVCKVFYTSN
jgi:hypothetical protein